MVSKVFTLMTRFWVIIGDVGDKFFIILSGETAVYIPNMDQIENWKEKYEQY